MNDFQIRVSASDLAAMIEDNMSLTRRLRNGEQAWTEGEQAWQAALDTAAADFNDFRRAVQEALGYDQAALLSDDQVVEQIRHRTRLADKQVDAGTWEPPWQTLPASWATGMRAAGVAVAESSRALREAMTGRAHTTPAEQQPDETAFPDVTDQQQDGPPALDHQYDAITYANMIEKERAQQDGPPTETMTPVPEPTDVDKLTPEVIRDLLLLVNVMVPVEDIATWSYPVREEVATWAGAVHLDASDNDVNIPARPLVLAPYAMGPDVGRIVLSDGTVPTWSSPGQVDQDGNITTAPETAADRAALPERLDTNG